MLKKYVLVFTDNGERCDIQAKNDGFSVLELIALLETKKQDLIAQMSPGVNFKRVFMDRSSGTESEIIKED